MTDWSLEREIADALGWHIIKLDPPVTVHDHVTQNDITVRYEIVGVSSERLSGTDVLSGRWQTEALCWEHAPYDDWLTDIDVALQLAEYFHVKLTVGFARGSNLWHVRPHVHEDIEANFYPLDELAEGICRAVLEWLKQHSTHSRSTPALAWEFKER